MPSPVTSLLAALGPLRAMLAVLALIASVFMPAPGTPVSYVGWDFVHSVVMPVLAPIVFMVLMLDALMSRVFMAAAEGDTKGRYRRVFWTQFLLGVLVIIRFLPYVLALGRTG